MNGYGQIEMELEKWLKEIPYSEHLLTIKGISIVTVAGIIGEVGDFRIYSSQGAIIKMAGLNIYEISSGKHRGERHISKRGRPLMRKILFFAALNVVKPGGIMHQEYKKKVDRGQKKIKALVAISRKLLSVMYAMVRDDMGHISNYSELKKAA
ncbi:MAG: transposase [Candidatus Desantisbacteria bacterium]